MFGLWEVTQVPRHEYSCDCIHLCRLYSCLANGSPDEYQKGEHMVKNKAVKDALQIGKEKTVQLNHRISSFSASIFRFPIMFKRLFHSWIALCEVKVQVNLLHKISSFPASISRFPIMFNPPTFGTFFIHVDTPFETIRYCGFEWWNNCVQCGFPKWFWMVGQLIQNLVWILLSGESMDPLKPFEWIWMVVQLATNTVQMVSTCVKVEILNGLKWSISRRVKRLFHSWIYIMWGQLAPQNILISCQYFNFFFCIFKRPCAHNCHIFKCIFTKRMCIDGNIQPYFTPVISQDFPWFQDLFFFYKSPIAPKFSWKKRSSHQGKKELACIVSKPSNFLFVGMWRVCNSSKTKHPGGSGVLSSTAKGDPGLLPIFQDFVLLSSHTHVIWISFGLWIHRVPSERHSSPLPRYDTAGYLQRRHHLRPSSHLVVLMYLLVDQQVVQSRCVVVSVSYHASIPGLPEGAGLRVSVSTSSGSTAEVLTVFD